MGVHFNNNSMKKILTNMIQCESVQTKFQLSRYTEENKCQENMWKLFLCKKTAQLICRYGRRQDITAKIAHSLLNWQTVRQADLSSTHVCQLDPLLVYQSICDGQHVVHSVLIQQRYIAIALTFHTHTPSQIINAIINRYRRIAIASTASVYSAVNLLHYEHSTVH